MEAWISFRRRRPRANLDLFGISGSAYGTRTRDLCLERANPVFLYQLASISTECQILISTNTLQRVVSCTR
jgi:hypothetical protein